MYAINGLLLLSGTVFWPQEGLMEEIKEVNSEWNVGEDQELRAVLRYRRHTAEGCF